MHPWCRARHAPLVQPVRVFAGSADAPDDTALAALADASDSDHDPAPPAATPSGENPSDDSDGAVARYEAELEDHLEQSYEAYLHRHKALEAKRAEQEEARGARKRKRLAPAHDGGAGGSGEADGALHSYIFACKRSALLRDALGLPLA